MKKSLLKVFYLICFLSFIFPLSSSIDSDIYYIKEMERISIKVFKSKHHFTDIFGYHIINGKYTDLPIGSTLEKEEATFHWSPGPGFLGEHEFYFRSEKLGIDKKIKIIVGPKFGSPNKLRVMNNASVQANSGKPFGTFETPIDGSTVSGSIAVTGWALDDQGVANVKIYRKEGYGLVFIGDTVFVEGARPDVAAAYPGYPNNTKAGWGYMMLTNFLPGMSGAVQTGTFEIHAIATDTSGNTVTIGTKTIHVDNASAVKPFGAIDTPEQGGTVEGANYVNWGWVLTPKPNSIPTDGSTLNVWVDGVNVGQPNYNHYRSDIARLFPGYANTNGAVGYFYLDTTAYQNGVHTIQWTATDNAGNTNGIGSRYFTIKNTTPGGADSVVLSESTSNKITNVSGDGSTVTFSTDADQISDLKPGDIIVGGISNVFPYGVLKEVKSVSSTSNSHIVKTENATLVDIIQDADISQTVQLVPGDLMKAKTANGVFLKHSSVANEIPFDLFHVVLHDVDGNLSTTDDQVRLDGEIRISPEMDLHLEIVNAEITELKAGVSITSTVEVIGTADLNFDFLDSSVTLFEHIFSPIVFMVGPFPVVVTPKIEIIANIKGEATAYFQFGAEGSITSSWGVQYSNGYWSNTSSLDRKFAPIGPTLGASLNVKGQVGPKFTLLFYGIVGPHFSANAYGELDADINDEPWWRLYGGFNVFGGVVVEVLSVKLADYSVELIDYKVELANSGGSTTEYTLDVTRGTGVNGTPSSGSTIYNKGDTVKYSYSLQSGYTDLKVTLDGLSVPASGTITMDKDHTLVAKATAQGVTTYKLTVTRGTGVNGTPGSGTTTYDKGTIVSYSYSLQSGYTDLQVTLDGVTVPASGTITMNSDHTLNASATTINVDFYDDFASFNSSNWTIIPGGDGYYINENSILKLHTGYHGVCNLISKKGYDLDVDRIVMTVRVQSNFNYIYGNEFSIGLRNKYDSHHHMIELNKLHDPQYGSNLDNFDQYRLVTRLEGTWDYTSPITANFDQIVEIKFICTTTGIQVYVNDEFKTSLSSSNITGETLYPFFRVSNADRYGDKSMFIDWIKIEKF